ncbi:MAG: esterase-like activity of phytase family protein [Aphanocapsa lilacina HA4352-LM1]|nr:esterase-like activity of phytase family protein [Aphanocapsa lilacina HA4352-LM1]
MRKLTLGLALGMLLSGGIALAAASGVLPVAATSAVGGFKPLARYNVSGSIAEIISASPDGKLLAYTDAGEQVVGFIDIQNPAVPVEAGSVDVSSFGEPTSVTITPNGRYALAAIKDDEEDIAAQKPGVLLFIDLASLTVVGQVNLLGIGPDSIALTPDGAKALIAIEDEEDTENLPGSRPGSVNIVKLDYDAPANSVVINVPIDLASVPGANFVSDPQPEFVAVSPDGKTAAVSVQENNVLSLIDIESATVVRSFSLGTSKHRAADLIEDDDIKFVQPFEGRREPDAVAFTPDGKALVIANEGDTEGSDSGGRGFSVVDLEGKILYDAGSSLEARAVLFGHYPDSRSENSGIELEGGTLAIFGGTPFAFLASERGSFLAVYDLTTPRAPRFVQLLPTGISPEGVLAIPSRGLVLTANEEDGTVNIFEAVPGRYVPPVTQPTVRSGELSVPWSALSGLDNGPGNVLYAVPDRAFQPSRLFTIRLQGSRALVEAALPITKDGAPANYDLEGIAVAPEGGFWLASEGEEANNPPNLLIRTDASGAVQEEITLPADIAARVGDNGFEGVAVSPSGRKVYTVIQRELEGDVGFVRVGAYDRDTASWAFYNYPLDTPPEDGWVGLSEITALGDESFAVIERDNQGAGNATVKRIYSFSLKGLAPGATVSKQLRVDLLTQFGFDLEKIEGTALKRGNLWVVNDNDGAGETRLLNIGKLP